jgi:hypothetical protein
MDRIAPLERLLRGLVRRLRQLAAAAMVAVVPIALVLGDDGFDSADGLVTLLLLAPSGVLLFLARGLSELAGFPERLRRLPSEGVERTTELARAGGELRGARLRRLPLVLWRLRGAIGSVRDVAGIALPLKMLTPGFLGLSAFAAGACVGIVVAGLVCLIRLV